MKILVMIIGLIILLALVENIRELYTFRVTEYTIENPKLEGLSEEKRIVFLSDLHNYSYGKDNEKLFSAIQNARPNLILIGGDMLVRKDGNSYVHTVEFLSRLPDLCEVYYVNGNHEQKLKELPEEYEQSYEEYQSQLLQAGIRFLENESVRFCWCGIEIHITGLEIPLYGYRHFGTRPLSKQVLEDRIGRAGQGYQILLAHNPSYVNTYKEWGADLILSGHLHGGIVRIPGIGGVIAPNFHIFPKYSGGIYQEDDVTTVVSKGLGVHSIPIRIMNPAEMIILNFGKPHTEL